jgi:hypothetical protein
MDDGSTRPTIDEIVIGDDPEAWAGAGFTVDDDGMCRVGQVRLQLVGRQDGPGIQGWSMRDLHDPAPGFDRLDGLPTRPSSAPVPEPAQHPIGALGIDHVVVASPDRTRTTTALEQVGFRALRVRQTDSYGAPMSQTFFRAGEVIIELVSLDEPGPGADGPTGFFGLALTVADLEAAAARLGPGLGPIKPAVQAGRRIATLRHRDLGLSVATALMSPEP